MGMGIGHSDDWDWMVTHYDDNGKQLCDHSVWLNIKVTKNIEEINCPKCKQLIKQKNHSL